MKFSMTGHNKGDCLLEVTSGADDLSIQVTDY